MEVEQQEGDKQHGGSVQQPSQTWNEGAQHCKVADTVVRKHVMNYLLHNFYEQTASAFFREQVQRHETQLQHTLNGAMTELKQRRNMTEQLRQGNVLESIQQADEVIQNTAQTTVQKQYPMLYARLLCQHFTELIRNKQTVHALNFAQSNIVPLGKRHGDAMHMLRKYFALLAYKQPELSPLFELVDLKQRELLADELNGRVCRLARCGSGLSDVHCDLERILRQLTVVMRRLSGENKQQDEVDWCLAHVFDDEKKHDSDAQNGAKDN